MEIIFQLVYHIYALTNFHFWSFPMIIINIFSFKEVKNHIYTVVIKAEQDIVSVSVPENVTGDAAGNKNEPSNVLQVMHRKDSYSFLLLSAQL